MVVFGEKIRIIFCFTYFLLIKCLFLILIIKKKEQEKKIKQRNHILSWDWVLKYRDIFVLLAHVLDIMQFTFFFFSNNMLNCVNLHMLLLYVV